MKNIRISCSCALYILIIVAMLCFTTIKCCAQTVTHVELTCYQPVKSQCNNQPLITADGSKINLHHLKNNKIKCNNQTVITADGNEINLHDLKNNKIKWYAISRDLLWLFPKNKPKKVYIEGYGVYLVKDVMNKRHKHRLDILIHPKDPKRISINNVKVKILK